MQKHASSAFLDPINKRCIVAFEDHSQRTLEIGGAALERQNFVRTVADEFQLARNSLHGCKKPGVLLLIFFGELLAVSKSLAALDCIKEREECSGAYSERVHDAV